MTSDGKLVGINFAVEKTRVGSRVAYAGRPDLAWLRRTIDEDYARRPVDDPVSSFWRRSDQSTFLAGLLVGRLRELEAARLGGNAPDDNRTAYNRQESVKKILADQAGIVEWLAIEVLGALPQIPATEPTPQEDIDKVVTLLRAKLQTN